MKFDFETAIDLQFYWYANSYEFFLQHRLLHAITQSYGPTALWLDNNGGIHSLFGHKIITMDNPPTGDGSHGWTTIIKPASGGPSTPSPSEHTLVLWRVRTRNRRGRAVPSHKVPGFPTGTKTGPFYQPRPRSSRRRPLSRADYLASVVVDSPTTLPEVTRRASPLHPVTTHHVTRRAGGPTEASGVTGGLGASRSRHHPGCHVSASRSQPTHPESYWAPQHACRTNLCHHLLGPGPA